LAKANFVYNLEINVFKIERVEKLGTTGVVETSGEKTQFIGGYKTKWLVPWEKLNHADEIIFHVLKAKSASKDDQLELMLGLEENSNSLPIPEIK
jgi:hypothetical protein